MVPILYAQKLKKTEAPAASGEATKADDTTTATLGIPMPAFNDYRKAWHEKLTHANEKIKHSNEIIMKTREKSRAIQRRKIALEAELDHANLRLSQAHNELVDVKKELEKTKKELTTALQKAACAHLELKDIDLRLCSICTERIKIYRKFKMNPQ